MSAILNIKNATIAFGDKVLWQDLSLDIQPNEFIAVIGANGSGKSTLLKAILGQERLTSGNMELLGKPVHRGCRRVGYIPQHRTAAESIPLRARDLLRLGFDGHKFGLPWFSKSARARVNFILGCIDGFKLANKPISQLSGGELQRFRVGQAVIGEPDLILADEPLSALDLAQQKIVAELIDQERREHNAAVIFVTHDVNPILPMVDRVLYLANGKFKIGTPDEVLRSEVLSELYGTPVDVLRNQGRIVVVGTQDDHAHHDHEEWK